MKDIFTIVIVICASSLICTLVSTFVTDSSTKKIVNLILGAFIVCSLIMPVKNAFAALKLEYPSNESAENIVASSDEAYNKEIVNQTRINLECAAQDLLMQHNIKINSCKIILAQSKENSIIISSLSIYINKEYLYSTDTITNLIEQNFGIIPSIITE